MDGFSIVIPVLRERNNLEKLIIRIHSSLKKINRYEVIIVDDNSNDGTKEILIKLKKKFKKLNFIIRKNKNRDLSRSCIDGFKKAKYKFILVMDGDLQHKPEEIYKLYTTLVNNNFDIVVGDRNLLTNKNKGLKIYRLISSILIIFFVNILLGFKTNDPMSGFFIFKKKIFIKNQKKLFGLGYKILLDLIYSSKENLKIKDVYIKFNSRLEGRSKIDLKMIYYLALVILKKFSLRMKVF